MSSVPQARLSTSLIATLDIARAIAALYVIAHHIAQANNWTQGFGFVLKFGSEAVIIFFILSGFVIYANEHVRYANLNSYFLRRFLRIYPTLIASIIIASIVAIDNGNFISQFSWVELIGNLFNLQDISYLKPGVIISPFLKNEPLWSLSYEVLFYAVFPFAIKIYRSNPSLTDNLIGVGCCLSYISFFLWPNHFSLVLSYFIIWWTGAMIARSYLHGYRSFFRVGYSLIWLMVLIFIASIVVIYDGFDGFYRYPFLQVRHFVFALIAVLLIFSPIGRFINLVIKRFSISLTYIASVSYGLYLFHFPLLIQSFRSKSALGFLGMVIVLVVASHLFDRGIKARLAKSYPKS